MFDQLIEQASQLPIIDWIVVITGVIYVSLSAKANPLCWPFGIVSCLLWGYSSYVNYNLWFDASLQIFYVAMGIYGWFEWNKNKVKDAEEEELMVLRHSLPTHLLYIVVGLLAAYGLGEYFSTTTAAARPHLDAFTTIFSIVATFLLTRRYLENWLYWIATNSVYIYLYWVSGAYLFALLMVYYLTLSIIGYFNWKKLNVINTPT